RPSDASIREVLVRFLNHVLRFQSGTNVTHMLRLWQVMEAYCKDSADPVAATLYREGGDYRQACLSLICDLERLGVRMHPVRFLEVPVGGAWPFQPNRGLVFGRSGPLRPLVWQRVNMSPSKFRGAVIDVSSWGLDCDWDPELSGTTNAWLA